MTTAGDQVASVTVTNGGYGIVHIDGHIISVLLLLLLMLKVILQKWSSTPSSYWRRKN